jgi:D-hydroxyproline dehydrogenase subunit gamma
MTERAVFQVWLNGTAVRVTAGTMASAVFLNSGTPSRISISGERRTALCGMGICFECRAIVDGVPHRRTCQIACRDGMRLESQL